MRVHHWHATMPVGLLLLLPLLAFSQEGAPPEKQAPKDRLPASTSTATCCRRGRSHGSDRWGAGPMLEVGNERARRPSRSERINRPSPAQESRRAHSGGGALYASPSGAARQSKRGS